MDVSKQASMLRIQNMMKLCHQLKLPVQLKVSSVDRRADASTAAANAETATQLTKRELAVIVHVMSDYAFKKYLQHCSASDLMLLRGLLLKVETDAAMSTVMSARVQQAFLPKFENEGQDSNIADAIVQQADERPMVITIKHSGSLVTLSHQGFAAKNSLDNEFTAGAAALLQAHFARLLGSVEAAQQRAVEFMAALQEQQLAVSFEMVTGCHGHHGQLPAGEYLVATSAHTLSPTGEPRFVSWRDFLAFSLKFGLPLNDTWIVTGSTAAAAVRELLEHVALSGCTTLDALQQLSAAVEGTAAASAAADDDGNGAPEGFGLKGLHLPGSYPHDQWQGSRIEGFVVSQGQAITGPEVWQELVQSKGQMAQQVISLQGVAQDMQRPYQALLQQHGTAAATQAAVKSASATWLPDISYTPLSNTERLALLECLQKPTADLAPPTVSLDLPDGQQLFSRAALQSCSPQQLQQLLLSAGSAAAAEAQAEMAMAATAGDAGPDGPGSITDSSSRLQALRIKAMQVLAGSVSSGQSALRYKKKMMMWSETEVGYCMMTFVIRNGLTALRQGELPYLSSLANLARNAWGLPQPLVAKVVHFGRCWARWIASHGGVASVSDSTYLTAAEPFVKAFLAGTAGTGSGGRPAGSFQGVLLAVDVEEGVLKQLVKSLHLQHQLEPTQPLLFFSRSLVSEGCVVWFKQGTFGAKGKAIGDFLKAAAPCAYLLVQPPRVTGLTDPKAIKKAQGMHTNKVNILSGQLRAAGLAPEQLQQRTISLQPVTAAAAAERQDLQQQQQQEEQQQEQHAKQQQVELQDHQIQVLVQQLGPGVPLAPADPAFIFSFVSLPGTGKSVLSAELSQLAGSSENTTLKVLNSDLLKAKQSITGMRYWHQVAGATESCCGGGHRVLVFADKNLVPYPRDNVARVADVINKSGATTFAVLPVCTVDPSHAMQQQQQLPQNLPQLPFPLELVALSMLRVLLRANHEGGLDGSLGHACSVVVQFAGFFRHLGQQRLKEILQECFGHVIELPVAAVTGEKQVPTAVLQHIAEGLASLQDSANPPLPPEWEARMRELLRDPATQAAINSIALPLADCTAHLHRQIASIIDGSSTASAEAAAGASRNAVEQPQVQVRYIGVAVTGEAQVQQQLQQVWLQLQSQQRQQQQQQEGGELQQQPSVKEAGQLAELQLEEPQAKRQKQGMAPLRVKSSLHVTLWYSADDASVELRDKLLAAAGQDVQLQLVAIDTSPEVTAAQAELLDGPSCVIEAWKQLQYPHITLAVTAGAQAADSKQLPARVADASDPAQRLVLQEPLVLSGQVLAYT